MYFKKNHKKAGKKIIPLLVKQNMTAAASGGQPAADDTFDEMEFLAPLKDLVSKKVGIQVEIYVLGSEGAPATKGKPQPNKPSISFIDAEGKE